jgi:phosphoadenosine phosphosulfate reductase
MWQLIIENGMPPLRQKRYCCRILKEGGGEGRRVLTGIRWAESVRRSKREMVEDCYRGKHRTYLHPIIDWTDSDIWEFINTNSVRYCSLYDEGWKRLGCVLCPNGNQRKQAERWPKIADSYRRACIRAFDKAKLDGKTRTWKDGNEMFDWWVSGGGNSNDPDQTVMFE